MLRNRTRRTSRKERLWVRDQWRDFPVEQVPVEGLVLNVDNHRFQAERAGVEAKIGRSLDPENNQDDSRIVESILLDEGWDVEDGRVVGGKVSKDAKALEDDWERRHQEVPLWIRPDGTVRNGNRRLAILLRLQRDKGIEGHEYVDAVILEPADIDEVDLFDMEQREQLTENLKVRYTDINLLLAIREAALVHGIDWWDPDGVKRVALLLQPVVGNNAAYAEVQLNAIRYMDAYLEDSGQPGQYHRLIGLIERFRDVGRTMVQVEQDYPDDADGMLKLLFAAIRAKKPHQTIRELRSLFLKDRDRYRSLSERVEDIVEESPKELGEPLVNTVLDLPTDTDADAEEAAGEEAEPAVPNVPNFPGGVVAAAIDDALDGFNAAKGTSVARTLVQCVNRLDALRENEERLRLALRSKEGEEVRRALSQVIAWVDEFRHLLQD